MTDVVVSILREYHRRLTHYKQVLPRDREPLADAQIQGELIGLRGALGIALGGQVQRGEADRLAVQEYTRWASSAAAKNAACTCVLCRSQVRRVLLCGNSELDMEEIGRQIGRVARRGGDAA